MQTLVSRFVSGAGSVLVRQTFVSWLTFVHGGRAAVAFGNIPTEAPTAVRLSEAERVETRAAAGAVAT